MFVSGQQERNVLRLKDVGRSERGLSNSLVEGINATFESGRLIALVGADGAGKTTLMRMMAGILPPTQGSIELFGKDLYQNIASLQRHCGYMPQKFGLYEDLSVEENFALFADLFGLKGSERQHRIKELLAMAHLEKFVTRPAGKLSGGMKQKLGLACALLNRPKILLLDEPSVGVDPLSRRQLWEILKANVQNEGMSVVVATTYMDEAQLCDDVMVLEEGHLCLWDTPQNISRHALGRTYQARDTQHDRPVRDLQAQLWDAKDWVVDAVPEADGVRLVVNDDESLAQLKENFQTVEFVRRPATLEDGYLCWRADKGMNSEEATTWNESKHLDGTDCLEVIRAEDLVRKFGSFTAVDKTSFSVAPGEIFGLLGPNGAGKTTTFKMLCGLLEVTSGSLSVAGVDVREYRQQAKENIGYMSQKFSLYSGLSVKENFEFFAGAYGLFGRKKSERIAELAHEFDLADKMNDLAGSLAGGFKQRLAMAVALLHHPKILFLDEPTSGADIPTRRRFWRWMTALSAAGTTIVVTTHFMQEALYCDRILIQDAGKTLILGTPNEVRGECSTMNEAFIEIVQEARSERVAE